MRSLSCITGVKKLNRIWGHNDNIRLSSPKRFNNIQAPPAHGSAAHGSEGSKSNRLTSAQSILNEVGRRTGTW